MLRFSFFEYFDFPCPVRDSNSEIRTEQVFLWGCWLTDRSKPRTFEGVSETAHHIPTSLNLGSRVPVHTARAGDFFHPFPLNRFNEADK